MNFSNQFILTLLAIIFLLVAVGLSSATTISWDGNGTPPFSGTYQTANNWNSNQVPVVGAESHIIWHRYGG